MRSKLFETNYIKYSIPRLGRSINETVELLNIVLDIIDKENRTGFDQKAPTLKDVWLLCKGRTDSLSFEFRIRFSSSTMQKNQSIRTGFFLVGEDGFEPSKRNAADLQSVPFGHSGTPPYLLGSIGAGRRTRTPDLLITNQLLYQLSYTGVSNRTRVL